MWVNVLVCVRERKEGPGKQVGEKEDLGKGRGQGEDVIEKYR